MEVIKAKAQGRSENLRDIVADVKAQGVTSVRAIAAELNSRGILTPRLGSWHGTSVVRLLERLETAHWEGQTNTTDYACYMTSPKNWHARKATGNRSRTQLVVPDCSAPFCVDMRPV